MVSTQELHSRIKDFYRFSKHERLGLFASILLAAFIFSFRDWGEQELDITIGLTNFALILIIAAISLLFRLTCQKIYALSQGYKAEFKVWWPGLTISLLVIFLSKGRLPFILIGTIAATFMVKQRLGEFRYGFSYFENGMISFWGLLASLIMSLLFALGLYLFPNTYFFEKGLIINLIFAAITLIPLPQMEGLAIFFGSRPLYFFGWIIIIVAGILLLSQTLIGLIIAITLGLGAAFVYYMTSSTK
jgi:hypothetical protein